MRWLDRVMVLDTFQCRGVLLIPMIVGQGSTVLVIGVDDGYSDIFSFV